MSIDLQEYMNSYIVKNHIFQKTLEKRRCAKAALLDVEAFVVTDTAGRCKCNRKRSRKNGSEGEKRMENSSIDRLSV